MLDGTGGAILVGTYSIKETIQSFYVSIFDVTTFRSVWMSPVGEFWDSMMIVWRLEASDDDGGDIFVGLFDWAEV